MSPVARWFRIIRLACVAAFVMSAWAPADLPESSWVPEAARSIPEATNDHA